MKLCGGIELLLAASGFDGAMVEGSLGASHKEQQLASCEPIGPGADPVALCLLLA